MLDEFLGGGGERLSFWANVHGALEAQGQICVRAARYTFNHIEGCDRTRLPGAREIRGVAVPHGANERDPGANRGS